MKNLWRLFKDYDDSGALHALVNVQAAVDERTFLTKGGDLLQVLSVQGVDAECLDPAQLDQISRRFEAAVRTLDERFRIYQYLAKSDHPPIPHRQYDHPAVNRAIADRIAYLEQKPETLCALSITFVIAYEGWRPTEVPARSLWQKLESLRAALGEVLSTRKAFSALENGIEGACQILTRATASFAAQLEDVVSLQVLDKQRAYRFLRGLLNYASFKADAVPLVYDDFVDFQACDSLLQCYRDHLRLDDHYVQVLTLKTPPVHTFAHLLKGLQSVSGRYFLVSEWKRENNLAMRRMIQSKRRHYHNAKTSMASALTSSGQTAPKDLLVDDGALAVVADLGGCLEELEVNGRYFGQFSLTLVLYDTDWNALKRAVAQCVKVLGTHDAQLTEERYNLLNAWAATLPGNHVYNLRRLWISNTNYAGLSFLFAPRTGEAESAHLGAEYLAVLEGEAGVPYLLNLHHQDNGHSLILGATGSGKSFFLNFLLTHLQKYRPFTYIFDLGGSYQSLTQLFGGTYVPVAPGSRAFTINPFCLEPTRENLSFQFSFCKVLIEANGYRMSAAEERDLSEQIENLYATEPDQRRLFTLANILNRTLRVQLQKWTQGGPYGDLFDNVSDTLTFARFQTFDFEGLDKHPDVLEPLLFYVLHRANATIYDPAVSTTLKVFVMDEAWRFFRHPTIRLYLLEALKTWRKKGAAMMLATQSVDDLRRSEILSVVVESCATQMFLANPGMDVPAYREIFHLNNTEAASIARLIPKRQILIKRPDLAKVVELDVEPTGYWLYTSNPFDNQKKREAFERYGFEQGLEILGRSPAS